MPREGGGDINVTIHAPNGALLNVTTPVGLPVYTSPRTNSPDPGAVSFDITPKSHDTDGLMGFFVFRNYFIDINYRDGLVQILYDQNQRYKQHQSRNKASIWRTDTCC